MKKPRRHKARKARKSEQATQLQTGAVAQPSPAKAKTSVPPDAIRKEDAWRWHGDGNVSGVRTKSKHGDATHQKAGKKSNPHARRAKGPPPRPQRPKPLTTPAASVPKPKLAPHLLQRLAEPLPPVATLAPQRIRALRPDRRAALLLFVPTMLMAALLAVMPRVKAPLERFEVIAALKTPSTTLANQTASVPPFTRAPEALSSVGTFASHDLEAILPSVQREAMVQIPTFQRPPEAAMAIVEQPALHHAMLEPPAAPPVDHAEGVRPAENTVATTEAACRAPDSAVVLSLAPKAARQTTLAALRGPEAALTADPLRFGRALAEAARAQTQDLVVYNARYTSIAYPRGDVPALFGVCTDVVVRAYRTLDIDLQELVHLSRTGTADTNIDHRRTELLRRFLAERGEAFAPSAYSEDYLPGDIVTYYRPQNKSSTSHIAIVSDVIAPSGRPMIIHNRGWGVQLEDALFVDQITGHYRFRGLDETAIAALPRQPMSVLATKRAPKPVAVVAHAQVQRERKAVAVAPAILSVTPPLKPPMGLGGPGAATGQGPLKSGHSALSRCETPSQGGSLICRPASGLPTHP